MRTRVQAGSETLKHDARSVSAGVRVAYLLSRYPAVSHTFFLHEVQGLRTRGMQIETASINAPDRALEDLPPEEAAEVGTTFYVKAGSKLSLLGRVVKATLTNPLALMRGLGRVLSLPNLTLRKRAFWLLYLGEAMLLGTWMRERGLKHLHVHFGGAVASVGMLTSAAFAIPYSLTIHGPEELLNTDTYHLREKVEAARFVICISDFCRSQLCQLTSPTHWAKFQVVRLGVDPVLLTPVFRASAPSREQPEREPRTLELVCTGRLVPAKGHMILLEALRVLHARGVALHATLIGGGPELERLEDFVAHHGMGGSVTFASAMSHPQTLAQLRRADLFALASFAEGIPVALMEAMALGIPCVSTTIAGIPELIRSGVDGLLVPPANGSALADALESLAINAGLRKSMGAFARQRIISQYNLPINQELLAHQFDLKLNGMRDTLDKLDRGDHF